jgi:prefoldin subunit 5
MFIDIKTSLQQDLSRIPSYIRQAQYLDREYARLSAKYDRLSTEVEKVEKEPEKVSSGDALEKTLLKAPEILMKEINLAVKKNPEFNNPFFIDRLRKAAYTEGTFTIFQFKNSNLKVKLNLNETFGSLADYGNGIKKVREELGTRTGADISSHFWSEKYYGAAREGKAVKVRRGKGKDRKEVDQSAKFAWKYWNTMRRRMDAAGRIAPFWELLDKGMMPIPNAKRKGGEGIAYPINEATDFTGKTQRKIKEFFESQVTQTVANKGFDVVEAKKTLAELKKALAFIDKQIEKVNELALDPGAELVIRLGDDIKRADNVKVQRLEDALRNKEKIGSRIRLGGGVRIRTIQMQKGYNR